MECEKCGMPVLLPENEIVMWFIRLMGASLSDGWGNPDVGNIMAGMEIHGIPEQDRKWVLKQVSIYMGERRGKQDSPGNKGR